MPLYRPRSRCYPSPPNRSLSRMDKGRMQGRMQRLHWFLCTRSYDRAGMPSKILVAKRNVSVHECAGDLETTTVEVNTRMFQVVECRRCRRVQFTIISSPVTASAWVTDRRTCAAPDHLADPSTKLCCQGAAPARECTVLSGSESDRA